MSFKEISTCFAVITSRHGEARMELLLVRVHVRGGISAGHLRPRRYTLLCIIDDNRSQMRAWYMCYTRYGHMWSPDKQHMPLGSPYYFAPTVDVMIACLHEWVCSAVRCDPHARGALL